MYFENGIGFIIEIRETNKTQKTFDYKLELEKWENDFSSGRSKNIVVIRKSESRIYHIYWLHIVKLKERFISVIRGEKKDVSYMMVNVLKMSNLSLPS